MDENLKIIKKNIIDQLYIEFVTVVGQLYSKDIGPKGENLEIIDHNCA